MSDETVTELLERLSSGRVDAAWRENANTDALAAQFSNQGLTDQAVMQRFQSINSQAPVFLAAASKFRMRSDE